MPSPAVTRRPSDPGEPEDAWTPVGHGDALRDRSKRRGVLSLETERDWIDGP